MNHIIYASFQCSESFFSRLFKNSENKPGQEIQKYNRLLAEGLACNTENIVTAISELPINESNYNRGAFNRHKEKQNGVEYLYLPLINIHGIKDILSVFSSFLESLWIIIHSSNSIIISDILNAPVALGSFMAGKLTRRTKYLALITDLPEYVYEGKDFFYSKVSSFLIKKADAYIILTEQMNEKINRNSKPYTVIEGMVDYKEERRIPSKKNPSKKRKVVYTGSLSKKYGISYLIEGFIQANIVDLELHIYGDGDMREEVVRVCSKYTSIKYHGSVLICEAVKAQRNADLLVNPRPTNEEYTKYSFPSKNMEYMVSGTPVLTTDLPGMPASYRPFVFILKDETAEGICSMLKYIFSLKREELYNKGISAREYVLREKSNITQAQKIITELAI